MAYASRSRRAQQTNYWPGFVDALSSLLLVIIFLLSLFMLSQFFLGQEISGKDNAMTRLNAQIAELTELLQLEKAGSSDLNGTIATLQATLATTTGQRDQLTAQIAGMGGDDDGKDAQIAALEGEVLAKDDLSREAAAQVAQAQLNLAYTEVKAPFDGIVSAHLVDQGALVGVGGPTLLASIVQSDPIKVRFSLDEQTVLRIREAMRQRGLTLAGLGSIPVEIGLDTDAGYPHLGQLDYVTHSPLAQRMLAEQYTGLLL